MPAHASPARRRRPLRIVLAIVAALLVVAAIAAAVWLRPFPATRAATDVLADPPAGVHVEDAAGSLALLPDAQAGCGLVFQPGARVDPHAYAKLLAPVARAGCVVEIVKQPLGIAFLAADAPAALMARHPDVTRWTVGGHSLGGVVASDYLATHPDGPHRLLLWASYPRQSLAGRDDLTVVSLAGSEDGLATPEKMAATAPLLPAGTSVVAIAGGNHSTFGDYGDQPGDRPLAADRAAVQAAIVRHTVALVAAP